MMRMSDIISLSALNLRLHKTRSLLTSLGVIFGVGSVISMMAISEGAKRSALAQIESMGIDKIIVYTKTPIFDASSSDSGSGSRSNSSVQQYGITKNDTAYLSKMDNVERITTARDTRQSIIKGQNRLDLKLVGVSEHFVEDSSSHIQSGRWFAPADFAEAKNICVIGSNVKRKMFPLGATDVVGSSIRTPFASFKIVGILSNTNGTNLNGLGSPNDLIMIPTNTDKAAFNGYSSQSTGRRNNQVVLVDYDVLLIKIRDLEFIDNTSKRLANFMEKSHQKVKDWEMVVPLELLKQREATQNIFTIVMSSIAGISLLVGGIGIMNIMLASVSERKKEIGTRRALGAQKMDILNQFLIETVILTTLGGLLGIALGIGLSEIVTKFANMPTIYSPVNIIASILISSLVGVIFGTYPAWRAAQQNPIDVLRSE